MMGDGQQAKIRAERVRSRLRDTPKQPGEEGGPPFSVNRRDGTESPRVVFERTPTAAWSRRQPDTTWGGMAQAAKGPGQARGYADVSPDGWTVEGCVGGHL